MAKKLINAGCYLRRSDSSQELSLPDQRKTCIEYATEHGYKIVRWYEETWSGDDTEKRTEFKRMRDDASRGLFEVVLCWNQERFGRFDVLEAGYWTKPFRVAGVSLVTTDDGPIDWEDYTGRMMYALKQEGKHQFLRDHSRNVLRGQIEGAKSGSWIGKAPYGYKIVGEKRNKRLVIDEVGGKVRVVERIFDEFVKEGRSLANIAQRLNADKVVSPKGGSWRFDSVKVILRNPAYIGTFRCNTHSRSKYNSYQDGEYVKKGRTGRNPESDWIVKHDHHDAIISDKRMFARAQKILDENKTGRSPYTPENNPYLFAGKLRCAHCKAKLWCDKHSKRRGYVCGRKLEVKGKPCPGLSVREDELLDWLCEHLLDEFSCGGQIDLRAIQKTAKKGKLTMSDIPKDWEPFNRLKRAFIKDQQPKTDPKVIEKRIKALDSNIAKAERNLVLIDEENIENQQKAIREFREQRKELAAQLAKQPRAKDINDTVLEVLRCLLLIWRRDRDSVKAAMKEIDSITCKAIHKGKGPGSRYRLSDIRVRVATSNLNLLRSV